MFHKISERIIAYAIKNNTLSRDKAEEYIYGLEISLSVLLSYFSVIIIGLLMGMLWQSVLFLLVFVSVRRFGGGFHFNSQFMCYLSMCIICLLILLIIKYGGNNMVLYSTIMTVSTLVSFIIFPVQAIEKPLDEKEKTVYGWISRIILIWQFSKIDITDHVIIKTNHKNHPTDETLSKYYVVIGAHVVDDPANDDIGQIKVMDSYGSQLEIDYFDLINTGYATCKYQGENIVRVGY